MEDAAWHPCGPCRRNPGPAGVSDWLPVLAVEDVGDDLLSLTTKFGRPLPEATKERIRLRELSANSSEGLRVGGRLLDGLKQH